MVDGNLVAGVNLGFLVGVITGMMTLLILRDAVPPRTKISWIERIFGRRQASGIRLAGKISTLPYFWFGGPWAFTTVFKDLNWAAMQNPYFISLGLIYFFIIIVPLGSLIAQVSMKLRR